jgi:hypothetical protein
MMSRILTLLIRSQSINREYLIICLFLCTKSCNHLHYSRINALNLLSHQHHTIERLHLSIQSVAAIKSLSSIPFSPSLKIAYFHDDKPFLESHILDMPFSAPNLEILNLICCPLMLRHITFTLQLRELSIVDCLSGGNKPATEWLHLFTSSPRLEVLRLNESCFEPQHLFPSWPEHISKVTLPNLTQLHIAQRSGFLSWVLSNLFFPPTCAINISVVDVLDTAEDLLPNAWEQLIHAFKVRLQAAGATTLIIAFTSYSINIKIKNQAHRVFYETQYIAQIDVPCDPTEWQPDSLERHLYQLLTHENVVDEFVVDSRNHPHHTVYVDIISRVLPHLNQVKSLVLRGFPAARNILEGLTRSSKWKDGALLPSLRVVTLDTIRFDGIRYDIVADTFDQRRMAEIKISNSKGCTREQDGIAYLEWRGNTVIWDGVEAEWKDTYKDTYKSNDEDNQDNDEDEELGLGELFA